MEGAQPGEKRGRASCENSSSTKENTRTTREEKPVCSGRKHGEEIGCGHLQIQAGRTGSVCATSSPRSSISRGTSQVQSRRDTQRRSSASNSAHQCCNPTHNGQNPLTRLHVIVGNGNDGPVVQDGDKDHCHHRKRNTLEFCGHRPAPGFCPKSLYHP